MEFKDLFFVCVTLLLHSPKVVFCDAELLLKLVKFENPTGYGENGNCCEGAWGGSCSEPCDPYIQVCIDIPNMSQCSGQGFNTGEYADTNSITFESTFRSGVSNPFKAGYIRWPGHVSIFTKIKDIDPHFPIIGENHDPIGTHSQTFSQTPDQESTAVWRDITFSYNHGTTLSVQVKLYCISNWYDPECTTFCFPRNHDDDGHYTCGVNGEPVCHENYYGDECKLYCKGEDSDNGHYFCDENGSKVCLVGWSGDLCTEDVDECLTNPCDPNGNCSNTDGSYTCECDDAYTGIHCDEVKLFCDEPTNLCSEHSTCNNTHGGYFCICHDDWRGRHCDEEPYCTSSPCSNNATCNNGDDGFICNCNEGWSGRNCEIEITPCTSSPCLNGGQCSVDGDAYLCKCVGIWEGPTCQTERVELSTDSLTLKLGGLLRKDQEDDFINGIRRILENLNFYDTVINITTTHNETENSTSVDVTVTSHDPNIVGALKKIPDRIYSEYLPLALYSKSGVSKTPMKITYQEAWVKSNWYVILLIVVAILALMSGIVIGLFLFRKRRAKTIKKSGFDNDQIVHQFEGHSPNDAVGFDNCLYYETRQPEQVAGLSTLSSETSTDTLPKACNSYDNTAKESNPYDSLPKETNPKETNPYDTLPDEKY